MENAKTDGRKRCIDPLTGRQIHLALQNGFSAFDKNQKIEEKCFTIVKSRYDTELQDSKSKEKKNECAANHYNDLRFRNNFKSQLIRNLSLRSSIVDLEINPRMKEFIKSWTNPVFGVSKDTCLDAQINGCFPRQRKAASLLSGFPLNKDSIRGFEVIGQVDRKFIACKCNIEQSSNPKSENSFLLLIDQHAAHERIRLEKLQKEFNSLSKKALLSQENYMASKTLKPVISISLSLPLENSIRMYKTEFLKIGVSFTIQNELIIDDKNYVNILLQSLPSLFVKPDENGIDSKAILELSTIKELFYEHMKWLDRVPTISGSVIPPAINTVLCSYSCHGAIRFGDTLTLAECKTLIRMLADCHLPFQCAHGRPSIAPMMNLSLLAECPRNDKKPKLWRLKKGLS